MNILPYFLAIRPKTLPAALVPVAAACIIVQHMTGTWNIQLALYTALSALFIQIATNIFNDAIDNDKKADTKARTGPTRVTASKLLSRRTVYFYAFLSLIIAGLFAYPLIALRGWPILLIGIPSCYFTYGYTGGPLPLAYKGLGELFVLIFFGFVAVLGSTYVQIDTDPQFLSTYAPALIASFQCGLLSCVLIEINNIRDTKEDATTGKNTLAVRWGEDKARRLTYAFIFASYLLIPLELKLLHASNSTPLVWIPLGILALILVIKIKTTPTGVKMNPLLPLASLHLIGFFATLWWALSLTK